MKWLWVLWILPSANSFATSCTGSLETRRGELRVAAILKDGRPAPAAEFSLLDLSGRRVYSSNDGRFPSILYGTYVVSVSSPFAVAPNSLLTISQAHSAVRITLDPAWTVCDTPTERTLSGQVRGPYELVGLWVKAVSARGDYSREFELGPNGYFGFTAFPDSSLILVVLRGDEVLATHTVRDFRNPITIQLANPTQR
jgi:hypothetical protein